MAMERERERYIYDYICILMHYESFVSVCMFTSLFFEHTYIGGGRMAQPRSDKQEGLM